MGHEIAREMQILCLLSAGLIYSFLLLVCSSTYFHLKDAKQSNCTLHAVLNNWVYRADSSKRCSGEAMRQELVKHEILPPPQCTNKTWLRGKSVYSATTLSLAYLFLVFRSVSPMLISHCQDSSPYVERTKERNIEVGWNAERAER